MKLGLFSRIEFHREARMRKERPFFMKNILRVAAAVFKTALAQPMKNVTLTIEPNYDSDL